MAKTLHRIDLKELLDEHIRSSIKEKEITEDTKLFFVGTTESKYDLAAQKFKDYKELDKISIENAAFGTSTWGYACAYAKQYAKRGDHGVVVAFELEPGLEVFDVRDPAEYDAIGIPREIAQVFVDAEPYFAINTEVPSQQAGVRPPEFTASLAWLRDAVGAKTSGDNILDWLERLDAEKIPKTASELKQQWSQLHTRILEQVFKKFFGAKSWKANKDLVKSHEFDSIDQLIALGAQQVYTPEMHQTNIKANELRLKFLKDRTGSAKTKVIAGSELEDELFKYLTANGIPVGEDGKPKIYRTAGASTYPTNVFSGPIAIDLPREQWKYRFKGMAEPTVVPRVEDLPSEARVLAHNCNLLYKNPKGGGEEEDDGATSARKLVLEGRVLEKVFGYLKLFQVCKQHLAQMRAPESASSPQAKKFQLGIERIEKRLKDDSKHIYIDYLQFVFFSLLMQSDKYIGVTCPEIRGYAHIHRLAGKSIGKEKFPYGYSTKISASTMYYDDMTVILCKSLSGAVRKTFGHLIDFIDAQDYRRSLQIGGPKKRGRKPLGYVEVPPESQIDAELFREVILPDIQSCNSVDEYKAVYQRDLEDCITKARRQD